MHTKTGPSVGKHGTNALGLALAGALGAALGLLFAPREGSVMRKKLFDKIKDLSHLFNKSRIQVQESVQNIWGEVTEELEKDYVEIRSHILAAVDEVSDKTELTKKKFENIVDDTVDEFSKEREWGRDSKSKLLSSLKDEWEDFKARFTQEEEVHTR